MDIEGRSLGELSFVMMSDEALLTLNKDYLNHDYYTDVITFQYSYQPASGDVCMSIDRIRENAEGAGETLFEETMRVMVHGVLHLCGYADSSGVEKAKMREREDQAIERGKQLFHVKHD